MHQPIYLLACTCLETNKNPTAGQGHNSEASERVPRMYPFCAYFVPFHISVCLLLLLWRFTNVLFFYLLIGSLGWQGNRSVLRILLHCILIGWFGVRFRISCRTVGQRRIPVSIGWWFRRRVGGAVLIRKQADWSVWRWEDSISDSQLLIGGFEDTISARQNNLK